MNPLDDPSNAAAQPRRPTQNQGMAMESSPTDDLANRMTIRLPGSGSLVFNRYRLQRVLGRGGMGVVWLAVDTKLERAVALKFLPDIVGADPVALKELKDETRRGLDLAHPNIVRIYDFVDDEEAAAISMEFVDGKSLSEQRLARPHKVFSVDEVAGWVGQMCDALDYAHLQKRIVHRDLKPANLMVNAESQIKISDFGIARSVSDTMSRLSRTASWGTSGTLLYMSPQQAMGDRPRPTDDVYSIGVTLYELFTGKPPFYSGDITAQVTSKTAPPMRQRREELELQPTDSIPQEWEDAVAACLQKDPERRPQTAGELARRLGLSVTHSAPPTQSSTKPMTATVSQQPIDVKTETPATTEKRKMPVLAVVLGSILLLTLVAGAVGAGALWWWFNRPGEWSVQTDPRGAQVTMEGHSFAAPATMQGLSPGTHRATVALEGYEPREVQFEVESGQRTDFGVVKLERSSGQLILSSTPDGTGYEVEPADPAAGQKLSGKTPDTLRLPVGRYSVTMKHAGEIKTTDVDVVRNGTARQGFTFEAASPPPVKTPAIAANTTPSADPAPAATPSAVRTADATPADPLTGSPSLPPLAPMPMPPVNGPTGQAPRVTAGPLSPDALVAANPALPPAGSAPAPALGPSSGGSSVVGPAGLPPEAPGFSPTPTADPPGAIPPQPEVQPPVAGRWTLDEILANSEYSGYSEPGRGYLVYKAQLAMKESADGVPGKGTYKAIQKFQTDHGLQPTGQLDSATLAAMNLSGQPDKADWGGGGGPSRRSGSGSSEDKTAARKFIEKNLLGGRDLKSIFRR